MIPPSLSTGLRRRLWLGVGYLAMALGIMGIFLPLLPTTPFLLLAAACYARSSETAYRRLLENPYLGPYIRDYRAGRGVPLRAKASAITLIWLSIGFTALVVVQALWLKLLLFGIAAGVTLHLLWLPTRQPDTGESL